MKRTQIITSGIVAGLALLGATVLPAIAHEHNQTTSTLAQRQPAAADSDQVQTTPTEEQMRQMIAQCNSMMSMMHNMMGNGDMPEMMEQQNNSSEQDMMNPMPEQ